MRMHGVSDSLFVLFIILIHYAAGLYKTSEDGVKDVVTNTCANTSGKAEVPHFPENVEPGSELSSQPYQKCENTTARNYCFTVWEESPKDGSVKVLKQGNKQFSSCCVQL